MATQNTGVPFGYAGYSGITRAGAEKYPNPFFDIASEYVPSDINQIYELCTPAGTVVETDSYGHLSPVESVAVGDTVLSDRCKLSTVDKAKARHIDEALVTVKSAGIQDKLRITGEHPLLVWDGRSYYKNGSHVLKYVKACDVKVGMYTVTQRPTYEHNKAFPYDPYLCGAYLAEGDVLRREIAGEGVVPRAIRFTIGAHESSFSDRISSAISTIPHTAFTSRFPAGRLDVQLLEVTSSVFTPWILDNFGEYSGKKRIPDWVFHCSEEEKLSFIAGWLDGDGTFTYSGRFIGYSCSQQLIWQMFRLLLSVGIVATVSSHTNRNPSDPNETLVIYGVAIRVTDALRFVGRTYKARNLRKKYRLPRNHWVFSDGNRLFRRVLDVGSVPFSGDVYNIRVKGTHSYTVNGITCHNCEFIMTTMAPFRAVTSRVVRYFLTEIVVEGEEDDDREQYEDFINKKIKLLDTLGEIGEDLQVYGNVYLSLFLPFDRLLVCPDCLTEYHCEALDYTFKKGAFQGFCPKCGKPVTFTPVDRRSPDVDRVRVIRWNPKRIKVRVHPISGKTEYYLEMDPQLCAKIKEGNHFFLNDTPWSMVETALRPSDNLFKFKEGSLFHLRTGSLAGLPIKGLGIPPMLSNFKLAYYIQLLRRYDEAITLDYVVPFRVLYPQAQTTGQDALSLMNMGTFVGQMQHMVENHRKQVTDVQVAPFPIGYQMLGGEAKSLSPKDSIQMALDELFTAMGYPAELYKGSLSLQAAPVAMRLFEKEWAHLVTGYNNIIEWVVSLVGRYFRWSEKIEAHLRPVTLADDMERKALLVQAAAGQDISKQTAYRPFGIDYMDEQERLVQEQSEIQKLQQKAMEQASAQQLDGSGGENAGPNAVVGATPGDLTSQAQALAQQLLTQVPESMRRGELIKIKHSNPTLHALVIQSMDEMRNQAASQGQAMVLQQMGQGG